MAAKDLEKKVADLEKKLAEVQAVEEIKNLHREYVYGLSTHSWREMADCVTDDAECTISTWPHAKGKEEFFHLLADLIGPNVDWASAHWATMPVINVKGNTATGHWLLYNLSGGPKVEWKQARYDMEYVKERGKWKFRVLLFTSPWPVPPK
jgi:hypothetical protein